MADRVKLTEGAVARLRSDVWDSDVRHMKVSVYPATGRKTFKVWFRMPGADRLEWYTIGAYGQPWTLTQARAKAREVLGAVANGRNPAEVKRGLRASRTVSELGGWHESPEKWEGFLGDVRAKRKPTTATEYGRLWEKHILPAVGNVRVSDVSTAQVSALHRKMRRTPYLANRAVALLGSFFTYAEQQGERAKHTDPTEGIEPYAEHARERFLSAAEFLRLSDALVHAEKSGLSPAPTRRRKRKTGKTAKHIPKTVDQPKPASPWAVAAIRFLLLSGWREREALTLRWNEIDTERGVATLPDTKTGRSIRPLGAHALLLLSELPRIEGNPYVFPGAKEGQPLVEINRTWYAARHAANLTDVRLHDLRHSFASVIASAGGSLLLVAKLLGHRDSKTTAKYAHLFEDAVKSAADSAAGQIAAWMTPNANDAKVTPVSLAAG
jgi:integrase